MNYTISKSKKLNDDTLLEQTNIKNKAHLIEMYSECFKGISGCFEYHTVKDPTIITVKKEKIPQELKEKKKKKKKKKERRSNKREEELTD